MRFSTVFLGAVTAAAGMMLASGMVACDGGGTGGTGGGAAGGSSTSTSTSTSSGFPCDLKPSCTAGHECVSLTDNASSMKPGLRMSQLTISKPAVLASGTVATIVSGAVNPKVPTCGLSTGGTFNWLLQFDLATNKLKTGGAKPVTDPTAGYTFLNEMIQGTMVSPVDIDVTVTNGMFSAAMGVDLIVPIFLDEAATAVVILPLKKGRLFNGQLSTDNNCIGKYNAEGLDPANNCLPDATHPLFINGAKLDGHITLEDADAVDVTTLSQSLCVLLSGDPSTYGDGGAPIERCKRTNGVIDFKGDWCSTTNMPADAACFDAVQLGADFAASAVKIN